MFLLKKVIFMLKKRVFALLLCFSLLTALAACQTSPATGSPAPESSASESSSAPEVLPDGLTSPLPGVPWGTALDDVKAAAEKAGAETGFSDAGTFSILTVPYSVYLPADEFLGMPYADVNLFNMDLRFRDDKLAEVGLYVEAESDQAIVDLLTKVCGEPTEVSLDKWGGFYTVIAKFVSDDTRLDVCHIDAKPAPGQPIQYRLWFYAENE